MCFLPSFLSSHLLPHINRFQQSNKNALSWAALPDDKGKKKKKKKRPRDGTGDSSGDDDEGDDYDDDELELFKSSAPLVAGSSKTHKRLQPGILEIFRCRDANLEEPSKVRKKARNVSTLPLHSMHHHHQLTSYSHVHQ